MSQARTYNLRQNPRKRGVPIDDWKQAFNDVVKSKTSYISAATTRQTICQRASDDECEVLTPDIVSLKCPISEHHRIRVAARGVNCSHLQSFDLANFLRVQGCQGRWYCPICQSPTKVEDLRIDVFFMEMLKSVANDASLVKMELLKDGSYRPVCPESIEYVCINDDSAYEPEPPDVKPTEAQLMVEVRHVEPQDGTDKTTCEDVKPVIVPQGTNESHVADDLAAVEPSEEDTSLLCPAVAALPPCRAVTALPACRAVTALPPCRAVTAGLCLFKIPLYPRTASPARVNEDSSKIEPVANRRVGREEENESPNELRLKAEIERLLNQIKGVEDRNKTLVAERDTARAEVQRLEAILARSAFPGGHVASDSAEAGQRRD